MKLLKGNATSNYEISNKRQLESQAEEDVKSSVLFFLSYSFDRLDLTGGGLVGRRVQVQVLRDGGGAEEADSQARSCAP